MGARSVATCESDGPGPPGHLRAAVPSVAESRDQLAARVAAVLGEGVWEWLGLSWQAGRLPALIPGSNLPAGAESAGLGSVADPLKAMGEPGTPAYGPPGLAVGATFETVAVAVEDAVLPAASVTVRVTVKVPLSPYAWITLLPTPVVPSPNAQ